MDNVRNPWGMAENARIDTCAGLFERFVVTQDENDLNIFLEVCNGLPLKEKGEAIRRAKQYILNIQNSLEEEGKTK